MKLRLAFSIASIASLLSGDTLTLKNGSTINGHFVSGDGNTIRFSIGNQVNSYDVVDVDAIRFTPTSASSGNYAPPPSPAAVPSPPAYPSRASSGPPSNSNPSYDNPPQSPNAAANNLEIPSGTQVVVRLIDGVDSQRDQLGQTYRASVEQPVVVSGQTVIQRGSDAVAVLSDAQKSGKIEGRTTMTIALRSVAVNGRTYDLATSSVSKASGSRSTRSGEVIGGTAALGAIIGALAGGGRGAAIGAVSGGAVGTAAQVATSGEHVKIPSETVLTFALQNPLYVSSNAF